MLIKRKFDLANELHPPKTGSKLTQITLLTETGQIRPDVFLTWQRLRPG